MPSLSQSLIARTIVFKVSSVLIWEQHKTPIIQEGMSSNLLSNLNLHKSMGLDGFT